MKDLIIIKIGGQAISELTDDFFEQLAVWRTQGKKILLLHGGGPLITKLCQQLQVPVVKEAGVRVTDAQTLALTKLVLLGQAQPLLLQKLSDHQLPVVGFERGGQSDAGGQVFGSKRLRRSGHRRQR